MNAGSWIEERGRMLVHLACGHVLDACIAPPYSLDGDTVRGSVEEYCPNSTPRMQRIERIEFIPSKHQEGD